MSIRAIGGALVLLCLSTAAACGGRAGGPAGAASTTPTDEPANGMGDAKPLPIPDELKPAIEQARLVGQLLFRLDRASAHASDAVLARGAPDPAIQGYVAAPLGDTGAVVYFLGEAGGEVKVFFAVRVVDLAGATPLVEAYSPPRAAPPAVAGSFRVRQTARARGVELLAAAGAELCQTGHNMVVVPGSVRGTGGTLVYMLAATTDPDVKILAGHQRIHVGADGALQAELMSRGCVMTRPQPTQDVRVAGAYVTHHLSPTPLESHVFASLNHDVPLLVVTGPDRVWIVHGTDIVLTSLGKQK